MTRHETLQRSSEGQPDEGAFCRKAVIVVLVCFTISLGLIARPSWSGDLFGMVAQRWSSCRTDAQKAYQTANTSFPASLRR